MSSVEREAPKRKLDPLNLPKESVEPLVNLLDLKKGSAIMKERAVEVVGNLAEEEIHGPGPTALVQCDGIAMVCKLIKEDRSPKTCARRVPPPFSGRAAGVSPPPPPRSKIYRRARPTVDRPVGTSSARGASRSSPRARPTRSRWSGPTRPSGSSKC